MSKMWLIWNLYFILLRVRSSLC